MGTVPVSVVIESRGRPIVWPVLQAKPRVTVKVASLEVDGLVELEDGGLVLAELGVDGPGGMGVVVERGGDGQTLLLEGGSGADQLDGTGGPPARESRTTFRSERAKLPLDARPGPFLTIDLSARASSFRAVIPRSEVLASKV